jgi:hypothetical protein
MRALTSTLIAFISLTSPTLAGDISFSPPIDCTLGDTCYIQNFVDADPNDTAADYTCGKLTYDGHKGTDFALPTLKAMWQGVDVLTAAAGTVQGTRNHIADHLQGVEGAPDISGVECGNGVVIDHGDGWTTQYCHMMKESVRVKTGDHVEARTVLGLVGISGHTQFPHVHITIRKDGKVIDPFNPYGVETCDTSGGETLWADTLIHQSTGLLSVGITGHGFDYASIKKGTAHAETLMPDTSELLIYGFAFGGKPGDVMRLSLVGPSQITAFYDVTVEEFKALYARSFVKKTPRPWPTGKYIAMVQILRDGVVVDEKSNQTVVMP